MNIDKKVLIQLAVQRMREELNFLEESIESEKKAMKDAPSSRQSWSDTTRSQKEDLVEALLTKRNQDYRAFVGLQQIEVGEKEKIEIGTLVKVIKNQEEIIFFITPDVRMELLFGDKNIELISKASPVAHALFRHKVGDEVEIKTPGGTQNFKISEIQ